MLPHTTPNHIMRMVNGKGQVLANVAPGAQDFGWSRRNGFIQPLVDAELLEGLSRFDHVDVQFSHTLLGYVDDAGRGHRHRRTRPTAPRRPSAPGISSAATAAAASPASRWG